MNEKAKRYCADRLRHLRYIRNVYHFIEHIKDAMRLHGEDEVKANITQCLHSTGMECYTNTLTGFEKKALRTAPTELWYDRLENKWKEPTTATVKQVLSAKYILEDAAASKDIAAHVNHVMRHAKPANIADRYAQLSIIYGSIHLILRRLIQAPTPDTTIDSFIWVCKAQQDMARNSKIPYAQASKASTQTARSQQSTRRHNTPQPSYTRDSPTFGYRGFQYPSASGYRQST